MELPDAGAPPPARRESPLVVVVDDEPEVLGSLQRLLRHEPYLLRVTDSPDEALAWVEAHDVRLVISDQRMPRMPGTELLATVGERSPGTVRLLLTGYPGPALRSRSPDRLPHRILPKPWEGGPLKRLIRSLLNLD